MGAMILYSIRDAHWDTNSEVKYRRGLVCAVVISDHRAPHTGHLQCVHQMSLMLLIINSKASKIFIGVIVSYSGDQTISSDVSSTRA